MMKYALDIDDCLAGFCIGLHESFDSELIPHNHWDFKGPTGILMEKVMDDNKDFKQKIWENPDFWDNLPVIQLPCNINFKVACYITSSPKDMVNVRATWLKRHGFPTAPVVHCKEKWKTMKRLGVYHLIDDRLDTVNRVKKEGLQATHFRPWYSTLESSGSIRQLSEINNI